MCASIDTFNDIFMFMCFSKTPALSASGDSRPFSDEADGTILGEGVGMLVLKRQADAERDGDKIYAILKGIGILGLIVLIPAGVLLFKNQDRWFGRSGDGPSETRGSLTYGLAQTWLVYAGLFHLVLWLVFGL